MERKQAFQSRLLNLVQNGSRHHQLRTRRATMTSSSSSLVSAQSLPAHPSASSTASTTSLYSLRTVRQSPLLRRLSNCSSRLSAPPDFLQSCAAQVIGFIHFGEVHSAAGYCWKDSAGIWSQLIVDSWSTCKHCPEQDPTQTLSDVIVDKCTGQLLAVGYDAHTKLLNSTPRQRKKLVHIAGLNTIFDRENMDEHVTNGMVTIDTTFGALCEHIVRHFRTVVHQHIENHGLLHSGFDSFQWCAVVDTKLIALNVERAMAQLQMPKLKVFLSCDAVLLSLAALPPSQNTLSILKKPHPNIHAFISVQINSHTIRVCFASASNNIVQPADSKLIQLGSQSINPALYNYIVQVFGAKMLQTYKNDNFEGHLDLICAIEKAKRLCKPDESLPIHLPFSFATHFQKKSKSKLGIYATRAGCVWSSVDNSISIPYAEYSATFVELLNRIATTVRGVMEERPAGMQTKNIPVYFTGDLSQSVLFRDLIDRTLCSYRVVYPKDSAKMTLLGAVQQFSSGTRGFQTLQTLFTIGMTVAAHCNNRLLSQVPITRASVASTLLCDAFIPFVVRDEYLTSAHHSVERHFFAASPAQESILLRIYFTPDVLAKTVFDDEMENVADLRLHVPQNKRGMTTGRLFVFHVALSFENNPAACLISVEDDDSIVYGCCRVVRPVSY